MTDVRVVIESDRPIKVTVKSYYQDPLARLLADVKAVELEEGCENEN